MGIFDVFFLAYVCVLVVIFDLEFLSLSRMAICAAIDGNYYLSFRLINLEECVIISSAPFIAH